MFYLLYLLRTDSAAHQHSSGNKRSFLSKSFY